ncbi:hypothetical protein [Rhizobium phaseoli]|uniref:hypothetical protein n=1 Tax=Rhizobium phaseoli TaxID=396 RepID=UPI00037B2235|nr:hypothetical protein [Rhizobium phaseoli]
MASRIGTIIAIADRKSAVLLEAMSDGSKAKANVEGIYGICRALVHRRTPLLPTAKLVAEEGRKSNPHFPLEQTIYNSYSKVLKIWRKAYYDVMNIDADAPITQDQVANIDTSIMDASTQNIVDRLKAIISELTQRCNVLKQIIDDGVPVSADDIPETADEVMCRLGRWLRSLADGAFHLDEIALKVSRKTPVGTRIIDADLFNELMAFTDDYERIQKARKATKT